MINNKPVEEESTSYDLTFSLNEEDKTANIIGNVNGNGDIIIPISIEDEGKDYIITSISKHSFVNSKINSIEIPSGSKLKTIEEESFANSTIERILISSSVSDLKEGWCLGTPKLTQVKIMSNNPRYIYYENKMIIGKSDINNEEYEDLIFIRRDIKSVIIPSFIKRISAYSFSESLIEKVFISPHIKQICEGAFYRCSKLEKIEISPYSQLEKIEKNAFSDTSIESITLPSNDNLELEENWCPNGCKIEKMPSKEDNFEPSEKVQNNDQKVTNNIHLDHEREIIDSLQCPICYLAMVPPERTPMMIPECGHSICERCIQKLKECPLCHQKITRPVKNILAIHLIESIDQNRLIPDDINPPQAAENKLIPKIEPICSFYVSGRRYIKQKFYYCKTCHIVKDKGFCEVCAKKCHCGHDISLTNYKTSFCDCYYTGHCKCCPKASKFRCSFDLTYGSSVEQPMYQCESCHITDSLYLCQYCAMCCHFGHNITFVGFVKDKSCNCFDHCNCQLTQRKPVCSFAFTGKNYEPQPYFSCVTCGLTGDLGCCAACAFNCHKGHDIRFVKFSEKFFCDCGNGSGRFPCKILSNLNSSYLSVCPNVTFFNKDKKFKMRKYVCLTCGLLDSLGICEGCAINCHINHSIQFVGYEEFCCSCKSSGKCKMRMNPLLHNDRSQCDRLSLQKDNISACYTCYTCDKSGLIKICETCALKNHSGHDIHLLDYSKFDCHG